MVYNLTEQLNISRSSFRIHLITTEKREMKGVYVRKYDKKERRGSGE